MTPVQSRLPSSLCLASAVTIGLLGEIKMVCERSVRYSSLFLLLVGWFVVISVPAFPQTITGDISGDVTDHTGAVVPNVLVTAVNTETNLSRSAKTNEAGNYRIPNLPIGPYKVTAAAEG